MIGLYAGSFDPLTLGHEDVIHRASSVFDEVIVAVLNNENKNYLFTKEERMFAIRRSANELKNVKVITFDGLLVDYVKHNQGMCIIKGLRNASDFEQELSLAQGIKCLNDSVETIFLPSSPQFSFISSSMVKSVFFHGGDASNMVNETVLKMLRGKRGGTL